jgi:hypothetical protein
LSNSQTDTHLGSGTREVVGRFDGTGDTRVESSIATVVSREDRVLEARWVEEVDVELAVLAVLGDSDGGTKRCDIGVEDEGHGGLVSRDGNTNSSLRATSATIGNTVDVDKSWVRSKSGRGVQRKGSSNGWEESSDGGGELHVVVVFEEWML